MKRIATTIFCTILATAYLFASPQVSRKTIICGTVLDSLTREAEQAAVIQFFRVADSEKPIAFTTTDAEGRFIQPIQGEGEHFILLSNIGRQDKRIQFNLDGRPQIDLGEILVQDNVMALNAATVTEQRVLAKMEVDRMTYDVAHDDDAKTSTLLEMLRKVPMVTVDGQDNISVNGSSNFQVTVNGKPNTFFSSNPSQIFKTMPASAVKDIQVITNPGVKYDAEGVGGILNLTMAGAEDGSGVATDGYNGSLHLMWNNRGIGTGLFYSQQKDKLSFSLNANLSNAHLEGTWNETSREQITPSGILATTTKQSTDLKAPIALVNASASYEFSPQHLMSATFGITSFKTAISGTGTTSTPLISYGTDLSSTMKSNAFNANIDYQYSSKNVPGQVFTLSYQLNGTPSTSNSLNRYDLSDNIALAALLHDMKSDSKSLSLDNTIQADFSSPLSEKLTLNAGTKYISRHNGSDSKLALWDGSDFVLSESGSTQYDFYNDIGAAYTELNAKYGKISAKAGIRYEHTWQKAIQNENGFDTNYGLAVPSASVQYSFNPLTNIGLNYNMRISRPGISYLNPYVDVSDPTVRKYGNPDLDIEKVHNISLVYNFFTPAVILNVTGQHSFNDKGISSYSFYNDDGILNTTYGNIVTTSSTGIDGFMTIIPGRKTRIILRAGTSYSHFSSSMLDQSNEGWSWDVLTGIQQTLPWDLRFSTNVMMMGKSYELQGWSSGINIGMVSLTKSFMDDRLSVSLNAACALDRDGLKIESHNSGKDYNSLTISSIPINQIALGVSWTFGKQKVEVKKVKRGINNDSQLNEQSQSEKLSGGGMLGM